MSDLISRQDAIKAIEDLQDCYNGFSDTYDKACIIGVLEELPSAQRKGKWKIKAVNTFDLAYGSTGYEPVYECSVCGAVEESYLRLDEPIMPEDADFPNYCPNCGAEMKGEEDEVN